MSTSIWHHLKNNKDLINFKLNISLKCFILNHKMIKEMLKIKSHYNNLSFWMIFEGLLFFQTSWNSIQCTRLWPMLCYTSFTLVYQVFGYTKHLYLHHQSILHDPGKSVGCHAPKTHWKFYSWSEIKIVRRVYYGKKTNKYCKHVEIT